MFVNLSEIVSLVSVLAETVCDRHETSASAGGPGRVFRDELDSKDNRLWCTPLTSTRVATARACGIGVDGAE